MPLLWAFALPFTLLPSPSSNSVRSYRRQLSCVLSTATSTTALGPDPDAAEDAEDWSELDRWLEEGVHETQRSGLTNRPRWVKTSLGHQHEHWEHHNSKMRHWTSVGASERLEVNLARLGFLRPSTAQSEAFAPIANGNS